MGQRYVAGEFAFVSPAKAKALQANLAKPSDLVFTQRGTLGQVALVPACPYEEYLISQSQMKLTLDCGAAAPSYVYQYFASALGQKQILDSAIQTGVPHTNLGILRNYVVPMPRRVDEQEAIAEALTDADALIDSLVQLLTKKRQIKQGAMQELLTGKRRLPGFERPWTTCKLGEISTITMGRTPARLTGSYWGSGHKWLSIADLKGKVVSESKEEITDAGVQGMEAVPEGTLLMSFKLTIGRLAFAGCKLYTNEAICALRSPTVDKELLYYALSRVDFSLFGKQAVKGYTLNKESMRIVEVLLPSDPVEQRAVAQTLSDLDAELTTLEARLTKARALKQAMAQALLTGRIRLVPGGVA